MMVDHATIDHTGITGTGGSVATDAIWDAAGDLAVGSGANTAAKLTKGADGTVLTMVAGAVAWAAGGSGGGPTVVIKSADETVTGSTTLQDDDDLLLALGANEVWEFELVAWVTSNGTADVKVGFTAPAGATVEWSRPGMSNAAGTVLGTGIISGSGSSEGYFGSTGGSLVRLIGRVENGATPGNLQMQWAQNTSDGVNTIVKKYSTLKGYQLV
jgi:hypothetical protein